MTTESNMIEEAAIININSTDYWNMAKIREVYGYSKPKAQRLFEQLKYHPQFQDVLRIGRVRLFTKEQVDCIVWQAKQLNSKKK